MYKPHTLHERQILADMGLEDSFAAETCFGSHFSTSDCLHPGEPQRNIAKVMLGTAQPLSRQFSGIHIFLTA